jgi:hypothetical protein
MPFFQHASHLEVRDDRARPIDALKAQDAFGVAMSVKLGTASRRKFQQRGRPNVEFARPILIPSQALWRFEAAASA